MSEQNNDESVRLLLNPTLALRKKPWELNIQLLLENFLRFLNQKPITDLGLSGLALLTSSLIYKLKVENLFYEEDRSIKKRISELTEPLEVLKMPYRLQPPASDITDLISALRSLLMEIERVQEARERNPFQPGFAEQLLEKESITALVEEYSLSILDMLREKKQLSFSSLLRDKSWIDAVRIFMAMLYLAHKQKIAVYQDENEEEIYLVGLGQ